MAAGLASLGWSILVVLYLVGWWWKPCQKPLESGGVILWGGGTFSGFPLDGFCGDDIVFVAKRIREKSRCKKRICDVPDHASLLANKPFLSERFWITPFGNNKICISITALRMKSLFCSLAWVISSTLIVQIYVFSSIGMLSLSEGFLFGCWLCFPWSQFRNCWLK